MGAAADGGMSSVADLRMLFEAPMLTVDAVKQLPKAKVRQAPDSDGRNRSGRDGYVGEADGRASNIVSSHAAGGGCGLGREDSSTFDARLDVGAAHCCAADGGSNCRCRGVCAGVLG